jgi:RND family efflux transporter MFP subunit
MPQASSWNTAVPVRSCPVSRERNRLAPERAGGSKAPPAGSAHWNRMKPYRHWQPVAVVLSLAFSMACHSGKQASPASAAGAPRAMPVQVQPATVSTVYDTSDFIATLLSRNSATINSQVVGYIRNIHVKSGERVSAGQLLITIDPLKQQATVASQQAARAAQAATVANDRQNLQRMRALYQAQVASRQDLDNAESAYNAAKAQLDALDEQVREQQVQLQYYRIAAPRSGVVGDIPVHVGDLVQTNTLLTTVDQPGPLQAYVYVPADDAARLRMGLPVQVLNGAGAMLATGRIDFISPQVTAASQTVLVKATVPNDHGLLRNQQNVTARIVWGSHPGILVPVLQVGLINGRYFVFIAQPAQGGQFVARQVPVEVGQIQGNDYVIRSGLNPGDRVITSDTALLVSGMPVVPLSGAPPQSKTAAGQMG